MAPDDESRSKLDCVRQKAIISTRTTTTVGTWNHRTMYDIVTTAQVTAEIGKFNLTSSEVNQD
ncbi:hypothetical protein DPMN_059598 [Dreissena polymorpha]|uniref:Uncharacterized protein n=1 Tax=Dreissena polymorpha TaxID=45954 RepID=A0A9D4HF80_DREPO|nr:hypothetical protein DPMN_059598 [Dreissena polymorpha]